MQLEIVVVGDYICITQTVTLGHLLPVVILELERPLLADTCYRLHPELRGRFRAVSCHSPSVIFYSTTCRSRPIATKQPVDAGLLKKYVAHDLLDKEADTPG